MQIFGKLKEEEEFIWNIKKEKRENKYRMINFEKNDFYP